MSKKKKKKKNQYKKILYTIYILSIENVELILIVKRTYAKQEMLCLDTCQKMMTSANLVKNYLKKLFLKSLFEKVFSDEF